MVVDISEPDEFFDTAPASEIYSKTYKYREFVKNLRGRSQ